MRQQLRVYGSDRKSESLTYQILRLQPKAAYDYIRTVSEPVDDDILMHDELKKFDEMVKDFSILEAVEKVVTLK